MLKINHEEYELLKGLDDYWKWIARDENCDASLFCFENRPYKNMKSGNWDPTVVLHYKYFGKHYPKFQFIKWEDEEPYNIQELIEEYESEETEVKKANLIKELEEAKLQTSKEWLDGFNKGIERAIELTEASRETERAIELTEANRETEEDIPTVPRHVAKEIEKISELSEGWDFQGLVAYLAGDGILGIKDNEGVYEWARLNKKLFLQLLGGNVYKVEELEEDAKD